MSLTEIVIKRPLLLIVIFTVLILFGIQSYLSLNYNLLPKIETPTVSVSTLYPGASATEVQTSVTEKLEDAFSSVEGLDQIRSTSQESVSIITITFKTGTDIDKAERDLQRKADQSMNDLPNNAERPLVNKVNPEETPVIKAGVIANMPPRDLYDLGDNELRPILQNVTGVGRVNIIGGDVREIQININQQKLLSFGLPIVQVTQAINNANLSFPAGSIETENQQISIRYDANIASLEQLRDIIVQQHPQLGVVYLRDIAEIVDATAKTTAINHIDGIPSIGIQIIKQSDANAVNVSRQVKEAFASIEERYKSQGLMFNVSTDQSIYTLNAADAVITDLIGYYYRGICNVGFLT